MRSAWAAPAAPLGAIISVTASSELLNTSAPLRSRTSKREREAHQNFAQ